VRILITVDPEIPVPPKFYGGIERVVYQLINELRRRDHEVGLIAHEDSKATVDFFQSWPTPRLESLRHFRNAFALLQGVRKFQPQLVHSFSRLVYLLPLLKSRLPKLMSYQRHTGGSRINLAGKLGGDSLVFTGCSEFIANMGRQWGTSQWFAIPNFVDTDFYEFKPRVPDDAPFVFLSRVERIKGAHLAIQIARQTQRRLIIAGNRMDHGEEAEYWKAEIAPHINKNGIEYIGPVDDVKKNELLGQAAAMIVPIEWDEPFGIVFAESLACGTPVISCPRGALPEIVRDGIDGFLIRDVNEGCEAVARINSIDRANCRERAVSEFSAFSVVSRYVSLYDELIRESKVA
jgi:glycosyltransferase involved in cell wall biosynthesis